MKEPLNASSGVWFSMTMMNTCRDAAGAWVHDAARRASSTRPARTLIELEVTGAALTKSKGSLEFGRRFPALRGIGSNDARGGDILMGERIPIPGTEIELPLGLDLSRRDILKIAGYGSLAAFIAACGGTTPTTTGGVVAKGGNLTLGSYLSDAVPKKGLQDVIDAF